jgi:hypothetical protein
VRPPASGIVLMRPPACGIVPSAEPLHTPYHALIHPRSIADPWTAGPWMEGHRADMTLHLEKMSGDKQKGKQAHARPRSAIAAGGQLRKHTEVAGDARGAGRCSRH